MNYYEVLPRQVVHTDKPLLTYRSDLKLQTGQLAAIPIGQKQTVGVVMNQVEKPAFTTKELEMLELPILPKELVNTVEWLAAYYATPLPLVLNTVLPRGLQKSRRVKLPESDFGNRGLDRHQLSDAQRKALSSVLSTTGTSILQGETASGKTLIYRELIAKQLSKGKSALLLVPEIGLTPQALSDYSDLTEHIFVTHSQLTEAQRHKIWLHILQRKQPSLVIGPRSAVFSPLNNLGVVIIDEEHEPSYKQDVSPKYQTQSVASFLATEHNAKLIMGSATPRVQDVFLAKSRSAPVVRLPAHLERKPAISIVDGTNKDLFKQNAFLSSTLIETLRDTFSMGKQSLLYLNRRGTATLILCSDCGWSAVCPRCDTGLVLHHDTNQMRCHQCGFTATVPRQCPECGQQEIRFRGAGTKRIEADIQRLLPQARIARFDGDSVKGNRLHEQYTKLFEGDVDIIIGTQAVARSLDLPLLETVGVVSADSELLLPDFSASERAFQLLYQVIGRVGRTTGRGNVIIQTHNPEHPAILYGTAHDYDGFYEFELEHRRQFGYPPFTHLMALVVNYASRQRARLAAQEQAENIRKRFGLKILGPTPAFYERQGNQYRWLLVVKSSKRSTLLDIAKEVRSSRWQVDLDPTNLLF